MIPAQSFQPPSYQNSIAPRKNPQTPGQTPINHISTHLFNFVPICVSLFPSLPHVFPSQGRSTWSTFGRSSTTVPFSKPLSSRPRYSSTARLLRWKRPRWCFAPRRRVDFLSVILLKYVYIYDCLFIYVFIDSFVYSRCVNRCLSIYLVVTIII